MGHNRLANRFYHETYFPQPVGLNASVGAAFDRDFEVGGTNAADGTVAHMGSAHTLAGAANDQARIFPHQDANQSVIAQATGFTPNRAPRCIWTYCCALAAATDTVILYAGLKLTDTPVVATDDDQVMFRIDTSNDETTWQWYYSVGGTDYTGDTEVTFTSTYIYDFVIDVEPDRTARMSLFEAGSLVFSKKTTALTAAAALLPTCGCQSVSAASPVLTLRHFLLECDYTA